MQKSTNHGFARNKKNNIKVIQCIGIWITYLFFNFNMFAQSTLNWTFHQADKPEIVYQLGEKGYVQEVFRNEGILPDPFYGMNESKYGWIEGKDWIFESNFTISKADLEKDYIDLHFRNIDTYAHVFVNGVQLGKTASSFFPYNFEIKKLLKIGTNQIKLHFISPINYHHDAYKALKVKYPTPNDANDTIQVVSMSRKPQYQFGWDWAPRMNTIGFNDTAFVEAYNLNKVVQTSVQTLTFDKNVAKMLLNIIFQHPINGDLTLENKYFKNAKIETVGNIAKVYFEIENPNLYWPKGYGAQNLYKSDLKVFLNRQLIKDQTDFYFGISTKELVQNKDQYGTSFEIHWNGKWLFCKGGDYVPQDIFLSEVTEQRMKDLIDQCADSHFNMIRIWGGGYYLPDFFYRYCAEKGILIWQDYMFACSLYPGDSTFLDLVQKEAEYQTPRIGTHPNIAIFNGNNEVMVASKYWGFKQKYHIDDKTQVQFDANYDKLFKQLLASEVSKWTTIPYIHTSPLSHWGKDEYYRNGTQHYWGVWHGNDPLEDMAFKSGRFNAEYGFQSFPEYSTWLKISQKSDWNLDNAVIKQHQKSYVGNGMILKQAVKLYGKPNDFEDFIYLSQLTQAKAVSLAISSQRLQYPRVSGTIYWQINDCWPVSSWSSIDYYGNWKALQYRAQEDFENIAVLENLEKTGYKYYLFSDQSEAAKVKLKYQIYSLNGKKLNTGELNYMTHQFDKIPIDFKDSLLDSNKPYLIDFEWEADAVKKQRNFLLHASKYQRDNAKISIKEIRAINDNQLELIIENDRFAAHTWITSNQGNIFLKNNFLHLLPGKHKIVVNYTGTMPKLEDFVIKSL